MIYLVLWDLNTIVIIISLCVVVNILAVRFLLKHFSRKPLYKIMNVCVIIITIVAHLSWHTPQRCIIRCFFLAEKPCFCRSSGAGNHRYFMGYLFFLLFMICWMIYGCISCEYNSFFVFLKQISAYSDYTYHTNKLL